jgi:phosphoribosylglycinamide formyltransferase-1
VKKIAVFASGAGSNAAKIIERFKSSSLPADGEKQSPLIEVALIVCNKPGAGVLDIAKKNNIPSVLIDKEKFLRGNGYVDELKAAKIDFIVLAGFLWKVPLSLIKAFPKKIVNIHPALLPAYGGRGMYGHFVHETVINNKEKETGITIHYVDELYDHGDIIFQVRCPVMPDDTPDTLAQRVHQLEHEHYPEVVRKLLLN